MANWETEVFFENDLLIAERLRFDPCFFPIESSSSSTAGGVLMSMDLGEGEWPSGMFGWNVWLCVGVECCEDTDDTADSVSSTLGKTHFS